jgi:hypothetical protein
MSLPIFHLDVPELPIIESVDLADGDRVAEEGVHDLKFQEFSFRESSYAKAVHELSKKYNELIELAQERIARLNRIDSWYPCVTLLWRVRPYLKGIKNSHGTLMGYQARFRVAVIPDLSEEGWENFLSIPKHEIPADCRPEKAGCDPQESTQID